MAKREVKEHISESGQAIKLSFSGHESFQCRDLWLKKGFDFIAAGHSFASSEAMLELGVGKNMVASIRFWMRAFKIVDQIEQPTELGTSLFGSEGYDPYLEDDATLWLLHYHLVNEGVASTYSLIFNELRKENIEFNRDNYVGFLKRKLEGILNFNIKTVGDDFDVFRKMYVSGAEDGKASLEDNFSGLLTDLHLVQSIGRGKEERLFIEDGERQSLPCEIVLYAILNNPQFGSSISLNALLFSNNSPGAVFGLSKAGLLDKIKEATDKYKYIVYTDQAGIKELQFKRKVTPFDMLSNYYEN